MTEENQGYFPDDRYIHMPTGNLWIDTPLFWRDIPAGEWEKAVEVLRDLMPLADHTTVALTIAVGDALDRAGEEGRRAQEREATPEGDKDRFGLSPGEHGRLETLLHRCDAVNDARTLIEVHVPEGTRLRNGTLDGLIKLYADLHDEFQAYKRELGVPISGEPS